MAADLTTTHVERALKRLGNYRVKAAQEAANEGPPDGISGALMLALGLRESDLQNINNPDQTDHGCFQISDIYHDDWLRSEPGCKEKTWTAVEGHTAAESGYCPRYTPALNYALKMLKANRLAAMRLGVPENKAVRFAVAAYNAGFGGAMRGWREGDVDKYTTGDDYSDWTMRHRLIIQHWLDKHPSWKPK
jgi:hypothetical protein